MASLSRFSDVLEEELNDLIQKAYAEREKTKIVRIYGIRNFKGKKTLNFKYQFDSFTRRIVNHQHWLFEKNQ